MEPPVGVEQTQVRYLAPMLLPDTRSHPCPSARLGRSSGHEGTSALARVPTRADTAGIMRARRTLATVLATISLLAIPTLTTAQAEPDVTGAVAPLARQPDGRLPLEGTPWRLEGYRHRDRDGQPGPEVAAFLSFRRSSLAGSGGCSKVIGQYGHGRAGAQGPAQAAPRTQLQREPGGRAGGCRERTQEGGRYELVPGTTPAEDKLVIHSADGEELLRYGLDDLALLDGAEWRLVAYTLDGEAVAASDEQPAVLSFRPDDEAHYKRRQTGPLVGLHRMQRHRGHVLSPGRRAQPQRAGAHGCSVHPRAGCAGGGDDGGAGRLGHPARAAL